MTQPLKDFKKCVLVSVSGGRDFSWPPFLCHLAPVKGRKATTWFMPGHSIFKAMFEFIMRSLGVVLVEWLFGGILKGMRWVGYRIFSLFTGQVNVPVIELRKQHDDSIWPWVIISGLIGGITALIITL